MDKSKRRVSMEKVLIVDDEPNREQAYQNALSELFEITFVSDPDKLPKERYNQYDCYILDESLWGRMTANDLIIDYNITMPIAIVSGNWMSDGNPSPNIIKYNIHKNVFILLTYDSLTQNMGKEIKYKYMQARRLCLEGKGLTSTVNILHLSDTQFGGPVSGDTSNDYLTIAKKLKELSCIPDIIVISGDISEQGKKDHYLAAANWIEGLAKDVWSDENLSDEMRTRILLVPGNHDYDLAITAACNFNYVFSKDRGDNPSEYRREENADYRHLGFYNYWEFENSVLRKAPDQKFSAPLLSEVTHFEPWGIRFLLFNSAYSISEKNCESDRLYTSLKNVEDSKLFVKSGNEDCINILLMHNTPYDIGFRSSSSSERDNWSKFRQLIENNRIKIMLFGHSHADDGPKVLDDDGGSFSSKLISVSAPTARLISSKRSGDSRRGFNVIQLERKDGVYINCTIRKYEINASNPSERPIKEGFFPLC